ncbi:peroxiredoxin [Candidatus Gottesmanbacteria bacterium CG11_big_fil_rev_8_21_14_0_20_37_11]|uniref:Peroxiredoxin n=3 Tax=Microgenomates group TaxID=1794810 RepID=A0A1J4TMQ2_9BACT|nr:MAG: peroxiredoxin [Candidatus Gottesmanbacteria bacterium CG1_02_37_22]PIP32313.1 MAG: peroxiredoxin [Candidatus Gottesmanbacteria bacterium CG23_combo_of_CG06-09_8_20_14_all_37_19]PIR08630.1 MAG: peroxiredoxin [Candidatus Gottesmanbacteria bacterium CG11_big_fil_rev_8_21_14_0_20_37_11]
MVQIGEKVQDFMLDAYLANKITKIKLSDYKDKWVVLLFYPADFTFVCPTELSEAADYHEEFQKEGAEILSISTDTAYAHKAWHDQSPSISKIKYPMLADPTGKVCRLFGTYIENEGLSFRATFIIDPKGVLKSMEIHDNSIGRSSGEILRKLQASIFVSEHHGEVCPASWKPGGKTLKTGLNLVGKI